jgi:hypothetical protein
VVDATPTRCSHLRRPSGDPRSFGSRPASAFSAVREPGEMAPYAPCRNPRSTRRTDWFENHQSPLPLLHVNAAAFTSSRRLPPTGPASPVRVFTRTLSYEPPLVPRFCHREPSFRHAFTPPLGALDRSVEPAIRWRPSGHMPPTGFCNWEPHEHTCERSKPRVFSVANHRDASSGLPFGPPLAGFSQARGRVALHALAAPRRDDRSPDGFTPT